MKKSGKQFTFSQEELEALLSTGDMEGLMMKMTGIKKKRASAKDIDALVDDILGDINNMGRTKKRVTKPASSPSAGYGSCGMQSFSSGGCGR